MEFKAAITIGALLLLGLPIYGHASECGTTVNSAWQLQYKTKSLKKIALNKFITQYCEPEAPKNANTTIEILDKDGKTVYSKSVFLQTQTSTDILSKKKPNKIKTSVQNDDSPVLIFKYPTTEKNKNAKKIRITVSGPQPFKGEAKLE